ncbi:MAG: hypothetical protein GY841_15715 [FCB group bacterium]|nr:hypothetical protein [FCB group bacterium]
MTICNAFAIDELQLRIIYSIIVAGKSASFAKKAIHRLFPVETGETPFEVIRSFVRSGHLRSHLESSRTGNYTKIERALEELSTSEIDLATCTVDELEAVHGIGPKTARFFILWTRPDSRYAALDVHILRWLRKQGYDVPKSTPSGKKYAEIEKLFLSLADRIGMKPSELDAKIWADSSQKRRTT